MFINEQRSKTGTCFEEKYSISRFIDLEDWHGLEILIHFVYLIRQNTANFEESHQMQPKMQKSAQI